MPTVKGILLFPNLFIPKKMKGYEDKPPRFSIVQALPPGDPQIQVIQNEVDILKASAYPNPAKPPANVAVGLYKDRFFGADYYDPRLENYYIISATSKDDDPPYVLDVARQPLMDKSQVKGGMVAWVNFRIAIHQSGIGAFLNGVMAAGEVGPFGVFDGRPSIDDMFADVPTQIQVTPASASAPPVASPPAAQPVKTMTAKAAGATYEQFVAQGWTDVQMVEHGYLVIT